MSPIPHRADNPIAAAGAGHRRARCDPPRRRHRRLPALEPRIHRDLDPDHGEQRHSRRSATAQLNIRFNNLQQRRRPGRDGRGGRGARGARREVRARISGEAFLTPPGQLYDLIVDAIREETGIEPELSTSGGTSDGRFLIALCPVVDFGLPNATMHKLDESAAVEDIQALSRIYERVLVQGAALRRPTAALPSALCAPRRGTRSSIIGGE